MTAGEIAKKLTEKLLTFQEQLSDRDYLTVDRLEVLKCIRDNLEVEIKKILEEDKE